MSLNEEIEILCCNARAASATLALASTEKKNAVLLGIAERLLLESDKIIEANTKDIELAGENGVPPTMLDRLTLTKKRIAAMSDSLRELCDLEDPIGKGEEWSRPSGINIRRIRVPLGVVAIIYEARPNVTVDSAALCLKTGNAVVLRGGKEAINTNKALVAVMKSAIEQCGLDPHSVELIESVERESANILMSMRGYIDVLIPRGGKGLIKAVTENAKVPVIETGAGNCHIYIDESADIEMALSVAMNAKCSRPSVCNAVETMLVHASIAPKFLPEFAKRAEEYGLELRGCAKTKVLVPDASEVTEEDFETEYNDYILAVKVVNTLSEAIDHINKYSTAHSEAIVTSSDQAAEKFQREVNSAAVYVNASTRFTDGGEFGFGAEIGISTQKLHVRGPMGLMALTTEKYLINGNGNVR
ncbi:MAG: glutamate-5-semialdehyde dehydrogenase [Ruminococcaceae bacterium]|nr:glutamate-5-semialdehyde dehydrogenase [Oscillospiraceae bacterium]